MRQCGACLAMVQDEKQVGNNGVLIMSRELPYDFDLHYDVKTYEDVERIAKGEPNCSSATPEDLIELFQELEMKIPKCLENITPNKTIWVYPNGTWTSYEPLTHEDDAKIARKVKIKGWK